MTPRTQAFLSVSAGIVGIWLLLFLYKSYLDKDLRAHDADYADAEGAPRRVHEAPGGVREGVLGLELPAFEQPL